jgi:adenylate cyclase
LSEFYDNPLTLSETVRRLAAVVFTDIAGYTALSERDESLALALLEKHNSLIRSVVAAHRGKEIKTIGDAFLLEFDSTLDAVLCAMEIQRAFWKQNEGSPEAERLFLRIGVHVGDVVVQNNDLFGDAVNFASRIEHEADPGGICISEQVYSQVRNKLMYPVVKLPQQKLKNVEERADLYLIELPWQGSLQEPRPSVSARNRIAVMPFANISPDPGDAYFSDGLTEEIISAISEIKELRVIARTSVNRYRGTTDKDATEIGAELQVAYILEGSVRKSGNKIRVSTQLIDVKTQEHVWSNNYDRNLDDIFLIQSDIASNVADSLKLTLFPNERNHIEGKGTGSSTAYVAYLKGRALLHDRSEKAIRGAKAQFEIAKQEDSSFALAYAGLADTQMISSNYLLSPFPESMEEAKANIRKAIELDPDSAEARVSLAEELMYEYKFREAEREFRRAISLNPSYATAHHWYSNCLADLGHREKSHSEIMMAEELDPLSSIITLSVIYNCLEHAKFEEAQQRLKKLVEIDPASQLVNEGFMVYHFTRKEWDKTLEYIKKMREVEPNDPYLDADEAYIYGVTGRGPEALDLISKIDKEVPEDAGTKYSLLAFVYSGFDLDECFRLLNRAFEAREVFFGWYRQSPYFDNVRKDPRFNELLKRADLL